MIAAVWGGAPADFGQAVRAELNASDLALQQSQDVLPAEQWLARFPDQVGEAQRLADQVNRDRRMALGYLHTVDAGAWTEAQARVRIDILQEIEPLDSQFGVYPRKTVPDALRESLFGQPELTEAEIAAYGGVEAVPPMRSYAVLDAAKDPYALAGLLSSSRLTHRSLLQEENQEGPDENRAHAPYLVELAEDQPFTGRLFTGSKGINGLWEKRLGIYIRSRAAFDELYAHVRAFVHIRDEHGARYFMRFWEETWALDLFEAFHRDYAGLFFKPVSSVLTLAGDIAFIAKPQAILFQAGQGDRIVMPDWKTIVEARRSGLKRRAMELFRERCEDAETIIDYFVTHGVKSEYLLRRYLEFCFERDLSGSMLSSASVVFDRTGVSPQKTYDDFVAYIGRGKALKRIRLDLGFDHG